MDGERGLVASHRFPRLAEKFHDKRYRDGYVAAHTRGVLARQMRNFRGQMSQSDFATKIGKQKTVVGRLENPAYGGWSLRTMLEFARKQDVAILVRFVDFPTFLGFTDDMSDESLHPPAYDQDEIDRFAAYQSRQISYHDFSPSLSTAGIAMGPSVYGDIFFGQAIKPSPLDNLTYATAPTISLTAGTFVASGLGSTVQVVSGAIPNFAGQTVGWLGPQVFSVGGFTVSPPTPGVLAKANAEIKRLNNLVVAQQNQISELQAKLPYAGGAQVLPSISNPQAQVIQFPRRAA